VAAFLGPDPVARFVPCAPPRALAASKVKQRGLGTRRNKSRLDEAREVLSDVIMSHVPVVRFDFRAKLTYTAVMMRRMMYAILDDSFIDDRWGSSVVFKKF
jgi:hypothetical protein